ncbi:hypothetical protein ACOSQ4_003299 [Xanthoceras sorbifolium]
MAETTSIDDMEAKQGSSADSMMIEESKDMETPDVQNAAMKIERARGAYRDYEDHKPSKLEIWSWYLYGLCSYFVLTILVPVVFPLIISQIHPSPVRGSDKSSIGLVCEPHQMELYEKVTRRSISVKNLHFSPLEWTSISWVAGLILSSPLIPLISTHLDYSHNQQLIAGAATGIGSLFFLPVGFFNTTLIFPLYITAIVAAYVVASASHTRHLGLMVRGFTGAALHKSQFPARRGVSSWFSLYSTVFGCLGSAVMSAFTYHMLTKHAGERLVSLWVVSIFSGVKWLLLGIFHVISIKPGAVTAPMDSSSKPYYYYFLSLFKYPHAVGTLAVVFLSSFTTMSIFTGGLLHLVGQQCLEPIFILYFFLTYFIFPSFSLPLSQPLQQLIKADSVKMQLAGFFLAVVTSGVGYHFKENKWEKQHILVFAGIHSTCTGLLHAFGRVLLLDCSPHGREGAFSLWFSWVKTLGTCAGFALASAFPGNISASFRIAFCTAVIGIFTLIFGNISDVGGAKAAGVVVHQDSSDKGSPLDTTSSIIIKQPLHHDHHQTT